MRLVQENYALKKVVKVEIKVEINFFWRNQKQLAIHFQESISGIRTHHHPHLRVRHRREVLQEIPRPNPHYHLQNPIQAIQRSAKRPILPLLRILCVWVMSVWRLMRIIIVMIMMIIIIIIVPCCNVRDILVPWQLAVSTFHISYFKFMSPVLQQVILYQSSFPNCTMYRIHPCNDSIRIFLIFTSYYISLRFLNLIWSESYMGCILSQSCKSLFSTVKEIKSCRGSGPTEDVVS